MVQEFYAFYATTALSSLPMGKKTLAQPRFTHTRVRGRQVDISETTICYMLFGPVFPAPRSIAKYVRILGKTSDKTQMRDLAQRASLITWVTILIAELGLDPEWIDTR